MKMNERMFFLLLRKMTAMKGTKYETGSKNFFLDETAASKNCEACDKVVVFRGKTSRSKRQHMKNHSKLFTKTSNKVSKKINSVQIVEIMLRQKKQILIRKASFPTLSLH